MTATDILPLILEVETAVEGWEHVGHPATVDRLGCTRVERRFRHSIGIS